MKKYKLVIPCITGEYDNIVEGFALAEERARQMLDKYLPDYPDCMVACFEKREPMYTNDYLVYCCDYFGDRYWKKAVMGTHFPLSFRLLNEQEKEELEELRHEKKRFVSELSDEELQRLRKEVVVGSVFISDYQNSLGLDEEYVADICDSYEEYLISDEYGNHAPSSQWIEDTPEEFVYYCQYLIEN